MAYQERPTSSVYSDSFELEELAIRLSEEAEAQEIHTIKALEDERDMLYREVEAKRVTWNYKERNKWLANRNAI
ncbi:hypothetical protein V8C37DRAFT_414937 [Trichoderma ceciliae]